MRTPLEPPKVVFTDENYIHKGYIEAFESRCKASDHCYVNLDEFLKKAARIALERSAEDHELYSVYHSMAVVELAAELKGKS